MAAVDYAVASRSIVVNLSPDPAKHPDQHAMFAKFAAHPQPLGIFSGWANPESEMVSLLSKKDGVVVMGAPNLSFLRSMKVSTYKLPHHRTKAKLDKTKIYLTFQSNEGDTPKDAYSFRGGNFLLDRSVPISWGSAPIIAEVFPGLWEYYVLNARGTDQFFSATGGAGYAYPWSLPDPQAYFKKAARLNEAHMPAGGLLGGHLGRRLSKQHYRSTRNTPEPVPTNVWHVRKGGRDQWLFAVVQQLQWDKRHR
jgi:hypothetical protein